MKIPKPTCVDFETFGIQGRPDYPPAPVSVSVKKWGKPAKFFAWGHVGYECPAEKTKAIAALSEAYANPDGILFHNMKFDIDVAEVHLGLKPPTWDKCHDTMFLLFLDDPHQRKLDLKASAERLLGMAPDERDAVADWLVENQPVEGVKIGRSAQSKEPPGKYIAYAPPAIVGPYADGDVDRTEALFKHLYESVANRGMLPAYDRERRLVPILLDMERRGVPVDETRLRADIISYGKVLTRLDRFVWTRLGCGDDVNLDSGAQLVDVLEAAGLLDTSVMGVTKTGKVKTDKAALAAGVSDKVLSAVLKYRTQLNTCLRTFMEPWLAVAKRSQGKIYTNWHQTRGAGEGGTRTGRLSSSPNLQNIPTEFQPIFSSTKGDGLPKCPWKDLPPLPQCRSYVVAYKGHVLCGRDFSSQELRVLAHYEDGQMLQSYLEDPTIDFHQHAAELITKVTGITITRKKAKTIGFSILYGSGVGKLAAGLGCSVDEARRLLDAYFSVFPGIRNIQKDLRYRAKLNTPIRTIGGREYYCEPPAIIDGRIRTFDYKLLNYLIQGSSSDQTKDAMIRFFSKAGPGKLLMSVHDEILISTPLKDKVRYMKILKQAMNEDTGLDTPMLSDGEWGDDWSSMVTSDV
jgi:DNA polymerase-1